MNCPNNTILTCGDQNIVCGSHHGVDSVRMARILIAAQFNKYIDSTRFAEPEPKHFFVRSEPEPDLRLRL